MALLDEELSERELEILRLVAKGATNRQVARDLFISVNTVKVHLRNIFAKLGVESRTEATVVAVRRGLVRVETPAPELPPGESAEIRWMPLVQRVTASERIYLAVAVALVFALVALSAIGRTSRSSALATAFVDQSAPATMASQRTSSRWVARASLPTPRGRLAVVVVGGRIFAIGGVAGGQVTGAVEEYLPREDRWVAHAPKPTAVANASAASVGNMIYVPGGYDATGRVLDALEVYDVATETWIQGLSLPEPRCAYALATIRERVYLFGGWDGRRYVDTVFRYDPVTARWDELGSMPVALGFQAVAVVDDRAYLIGGYDGSREFASCYEYDASREGGGSPWTECAPMSATRGGAAATAVGASIYVLGGGWTSFLAYNERYEPRSDTWARFETPLTGQWRNLGVVPFETRLYAIGGWSGEDLGFNGEYQAIFRVVVPRTVR